MKHNLLSKELKELMGVSEPSFFNCIVAVTSENNAYLIESDKDIEEIFDGSELEDNLTNNKLIPKDPGVYNCVIRYYSFRSNIPMDPIEWDCEITIEKCKKIDISFSE